MNCPGCDGQLGLSPHSVQRRRCVGCGLITTHDGEPVCPNCGRVGVYEPHCLSCFWKPGEAHYMPWWFKSAEQQQDWVTGRYTHWAPKKK
jgi:hypothetical protein